MVESSEWTPDYVVISIDGGGIRGYVPALILEKLEEELGHVHLREAVDMFAGTSTGGIISIALSTDIPAARLVGFYGEDFN